LDSAVAACQEIAQRSQGDIETQKPPDAVLPGDYDRTAMLSVIMERNIGINRRTRKCR